MVPLPCLDPGCPRHVWSHGAPTVCLVPWCPRPCLSCLVWSCLVLSCLALSCLALSCLVLFCLLLSLLGVRSRSCNHVPFHKYVWSARADHTHSKQNTKILKNKIALPKNPTSFIWDLRFVYFCAVSGGSAVFQREGTQEGPKRMQESLQKPKRAQE